MKRDNNYYIGIGICIAVGSIKRNHINDINETITQLLGGSGIDLKELETFKSYLSEEDYNICKSALENQ